MLAWRVLGVGKRDFRKPRSSVWGRVITFRFFRFWFRVHTLLWRWSCGVVAERLFGRECVFFLNFFKIFKAVLGKCTED